MACHCNPNISATAPATRGPTPSHKESHHGAEHQRRGRRRRQHEVPGQRQRPRDVDAAQQRQLVPALAGPAEEQAAQHVEAADHAERLRAQHRVQAADRQIGRQMGGDEDELHAADEVGAGHHHERRIGERDPGRDRGRRIGDLVRCPRRQRDPVDLAREPGRRQQRDATTPRSRPAHAPAVAFIRICPSGAASTSRAIPPPRPCRAPCSDCRHARVATDIAIAAAVHASDIPISTPAPSMTLTKPCAPAISARPAM